MFGTLRALFSIFIIVSSATMAFADVTVKVRQTVGGQSIENTTYIKGKRERSEQDMGGFKMVTIKQCDMKRTLQLNPATRMYMISSWGQNESVPVTSVSTTKTATGTTTTTVRKGGVVTVTTTFTDTGERKQMFGFTARHIIQSFQMEASADSCDGARNTKVETDGWYIDADFAFDCGDNTQFERLAEMQQREKFTECRDTFVSKGTKVGKTGYAVYEKTTMFDASGKPSFSTIREVLELSYATLDQALFEAPADYKEAKNMQDMYTGGGMFGGMNMGMDPRKQNSANKMPAEDQSSDDEESPSAQGNVKSASDAGQKTPGVVRIGLAGVKTGPVGDGVNAQMLAGAIQTTLGDYFKGTGVEIVLLEAKLPAAIDQEARDSNCDFVLNVQVSHKRGGGGFGGLRNIGGVLGGSIPYGGNVGAQVASETARVTIYTAADAAASIKAKDEMTLEVNLKKTDGTAALARQFKSKAKSEGEDIISPIVEQTAQAVVDFVKK